MPSVTFRLPPSLHERFLQQCEERDVRPSELIRQAIEAFVDRVDDQPFERALIVPRQADGPEDYTERLARLPTGSVASRAGSGVRGFSVTGEPITPEQQFKNRQAALEKKRKP